MKAAIIAHDRRGCRESGKGWGCVLPAHEDRKGPTAHPPINQPGNLGQCYENACGARFFADPAHPSHKLYQWRLKSGALESFERVSSGTPLKPKTDLGE